LSIGSLGLSARPVMAGPSASSSSDAPEATSVPRLPTASRIENTAYAVPEGVPSLTSKLPRYSRSFSRARAMAIGPPPVGARLKNGVAAAGSVRRTTTSTRPRPMRPVPGSTGPPGW
jgi:hypothetical protein